MKSVLLVAITLAVASIVSCQVRETVYVYKTPEDGFFASKKELQQPYACSKNTIERGLNVTGWHVLHIVAFKYCTKEQQAYAAGIGEAFLTYNDIYQHWYNTMEGMCTGREALCKKVQDFLNTNYAWVNKMIDQHSKDDKYWYEVKLFFVQLRGLQVGYSTYQTDPKKQLSYNDFLWLNLQGDLEELLDALNTGDENFETFLARGSKLRGSRSCSALIKLLPDSADLYASHDTWSSFQSMWKVLKKYDFDSKGFPTGNHAPGYSVSFSSYPGEIQSGDDFYITSAKLVTLETTTGNNNKSLWAYVKPEGQVMEQIRVVVANKLAKSGKQWSQIFSKYNSGTYNNQWMVVDFKLFEKGTPQNLLKNDLLWIIEQLPGFIKAADMTDELRAQTYWPSYNVPYFPEIYNLSGNNELVEKYGDWFTYDKTPRALIFKRDHSKVTDTISMIDLMRYNNFKYDPLSRCDCEPPYSGENAIAARNDLNPINGTYPFGALGHRSHAATDMKLTTSDLVNTFQMIAFAGPPYSYDLPPFQWSTSDYKDLSHLGQPDLWKFHPHLSVWP